MFDEPHVPDPQDGDWASTLLACLLMVMMIAVAAVWVSYSFL